MSRLDRAPPREHLAGAMSADLGYVGDPCHSSIPRAGSVLGLRPERRRTR